VSILKKFLKVKRVNEQRAMSELGQVNLAQNNERNKLTQLQDFLGEYTIEKTLEGRLIGKNELLNQNKFVGTIVEAEHLQHKKIEKLSGLYLGKVKELTKAKNVVSRIEERLSEEEKALRVLKQQSEDAQNAEVFNNRKMYD